MWETTFRNGDVSIHAEWIDAVNEACVPITIGNMTVGATMAVGEYPCWKLIDTRNESFDTKRPFALLREIPE